MKQTLMILGLVFVMNINAAEQTVKKDVQPTAAEIAKNRACFQELEKQGCGTLEEDQEKFRSCMSYVHTTMEDHCQKLMKGLYGTK